MRIRKLIIPVAALLSVGAAGAAFGEEPAVNGLLSLGVRGVEENSNSAKFQEYKDKSDGIFGKAVLGAYQNGYYVDLFGKNFGLDDQNYLIKGGKYGSFKAFFGYDETPHNYSFNNKSVFSSGIGTNTLTYNGAGVGSSDPANWTTFDQSIKRKTFGAGVEASLGSPFYVSVNANRQEINGTMPYSGASAGTTFTGAISRSAGVVDLPLPVDYTSDTLVVETGYRTKPLVLSLTGTASQFENTNPYLTWRDPNGTTAFNNVNSLAPESQLLKLAGQAVVRLPLQSALAFRGSYSQTTNNVDLTPYSAKAGVNSFNGEISYLTASAAYTISPVKPMDVKVYYNFLKKDNDSDTFSNYTLNHASSTGTTPTEVYFYKKNNAGIDVGYRLPFSTKADFGYEFLNVRRNGEIRTDAVTSTDNKLYLQVKNSSLDMLALKLRYEYLNRDAKNSLAQAGTTIPGAGFYDAADLVRHTVKTGVEIEPIKHLSVGLEYAFKQSQYNGFTFGLQEDTRHEYLVDVAYAIPDIMKLSGYFDLEQVKTFSYRNKTTNPPYKWSETVENNNYAMGLSAEVPIVKNKLTLVAGVDYEKADGMADFSTQGPQLFRIDNYDDYTRKGVNARLVYAFSKQLDFTAGYGYDRYRYNDISYDGYTNFVNSGTNDMYYSGAYSDHDYEAHSYYLKASYRF
ncbi:MAG: hypothetical protein ED859_04610 [Desulfuromonadales bacterium]|nr:MAG: hypothetical protein ED859_04610 [Desulfuromonadales bacterium]